MLATIPVKAGHPQLLKVLFCLKDSCNLVAVKRVIGLTLIAGTDDIHPFGRVFHAHKLVADAVTKKNRAG